MIAPAVAELEAHMATTAACAVLGRSRATQCRRRRPEPDSAAVIERRRAAHPRALSDDERAEVLEVLHSDRFVDESPTTVWATLPATRARIWRRRPRCTGSCEPPMAP
ncbi:hypothetical protein [Candidatus Poriferisodalis sp.]|uniref:hypothetical protein n=1 Tax=Candidatus Poriferisodalis sp. TaxID=3101277 RepID=UPI003C6FE18D